LIVIKVGGSKGIDLDKFIDDFAEIIKSGQKAILVHGGSHETNIISEKLGKPPLFVTSISGYESRFTDRETLEIFEMVYAGKINKTIVEKLIQKGIKAVGLSGIDGKILSGPRKSTIRIIENGKKKVLRGDYTGKVENVNIELLNLLLENGYIPVITPPAISYEGEAINVDGDRAAAVLAYKLKAQKLLIFSNVPGLLKDLTDPDSIIEKIDKKDVETSMNFAKGRMKKKVMAAIEALQNGVEEVIFADARIKSPIKNALSGKGTHIK